VFKEVGQALCQAIWVLGLFALMPFKWYLKAVGNLGQAKGIVKLPIGEKSSVGSDLGTVELKLHSTVEINP